MTKEPWRMVKNRSWDRYKKIITVFGMTEKLINMFGPGYGLPKTVYLNIITSKSRHYVTTMLSETGLSIRQLFQENWMMKTYQY